MKEKKRSSQGIRKYGKLVRRREGENIYSE